MPLPDYYEILEIHERASTEVMKKAYIALVRRYHPDANPEDRRDWAEERMKLVNEAYQVLSDPLRRKAYDEGRLAEPTIRYEPLEVAAAVANCYRHPDRPRVALCQRCGRSVCSACLKLSGGTPVCTACLPTPIWRRMTHRESTRSKSLSVADAWLLTGTIVVSALGGALVGWALLSPLLVPLMPTYRHAPFVVGLLGAAALGFALSTGLAPFGWHVRWVKWPVVALTIALAVGGGITFHTWWTTNHLGAAQSALAEGNNMAAFVESSAALLQEDLLGQATSETWAVRMAAALRVCDAALRRHDSSQMTFARAAVDAALWVMPSQLNDKDKVPLAETFSRISEHTAKWKRYELWESARALLSPRPPDTHAAKESRDLNSDKFRPGYSWLVMVPDLQGLSSADQNTRDKAYVNAIIWTELAGGAWYSQAYWKDSWPHVYGAFKQYAFDHERLRQHSGELAGPLADWS
ncbi:MAG: DnaJ domain-containing protein, partial [Actinobacteria bacterium]|nr:DnaJ domain-containing protein [Actinomycetota bacterium]